MELVFEDETEPGERIWPCNWEAVMLFVDLSTQWRSGMGGAIGLDYAAVEATMRLQDIARSRRADLFQRVRIMEAAALPVLNEKA